MQLIDLTVPLDQNLPVSPGHARCSLKPITRIAKDDSSNVATLPPSLPGGTTGRGHTTARGGTTAIEGCMPPGIAGADGPAPRVVLRKN